MNMDAPFTLEDLAIGYGDRPVVDGVTLRIGTGEVVAVLGDNGSGKTTLVRGLLGLARIHTGRLELFGIRHDRFRDRWRIGYVPQRPSITGVIPCSVREVVASGRLSRRPFLRRRTRREKSSDADAVEMALARVGLEDRATHPVGTLSGGQQRRTLIARALAEQPDVLVMDEPTASVDAGTRRALLGTLTELAAAGSTMIIVTHDLAPFAGLPTRAVILRDGRLVFDGSPDRIASHDLASDIHHDDEDRPLSRSGLDATG